MAGESEHSTQSEEILTEYWLKAREPFDIRARDATLFTQVLAYLSDIEQPCITDLGCGTGNQSLYFMARLTSSTNFTLVEQHPALLSQAKQTIMARFNSKQIDEQSFQITTRHCSHTVTFLALNLFDWLDQQLNAMEGHAAPCHLLTASALLDLLTDREIETLYQAISETHTAFYATLNYTGFQFTPAHPLDTHASQVFEQHMTRSLDRGNPLGPKAITHLTGSLAVNQSLQYQLADSDWFVGTDDFRFLNANFMFYQQALERTKELLPWLTHRSEQLRTSALQLTVKHRDLWVTPT